MLDRINVQVFIFTRKESFRTLILKRTKERSGYWQPVCGGINIGEQPVDTVVREVFEETGLNNYEKIYDLKYTFTYQETKNGELMSMRDICFAMEVKEVFDVRLSEEHEKYMWCTEKEAKEYLKWEHNLIALDMLMDIVKVNMKNEEYKF